MHRGTQEPTLIHLHQVRKINATLYSFSPEWENAHMLKGRAIASSSVSLLFKISVHSEKSRVNTSEADRH